MDARRKGILMLAISSPLVGGFISLPMYLAHRGAENVWYSMELAGLAAVLPFLGLAYLVFGESFAALVEIGKHDEISVLQAVIFLLPVPAPFVVTYYVDAYMKSKGYS